MSQKTNLQKRIDSLCKELGITESQYKTNTKIADLEKIVDKLEAQLPDDDTNTNGTDGDTGNTGDINGTDGDTGNTGDTNGTDGDTGNTGNTTGTDGDTGNTGDIDGLVEGEMVIDNPNDVIIDENTIPERSENASGDLEIEALTTFQTVVNGRKKMVVKGRREFLPGETALAAVREGVATTVYKVE